MNEFFKNEIFFLVNSFLLVGLLLIDIIIKILEEKEKIKLSKKRKQYLIIIASVLGIFWIIGLVYLAKNDPNLVRSLSLCPG